MLRVRGLKKAYPLNRRERVLFEDLSFDVAPGERLAVLGRNGQGKSTLIKILGGVLRPNAGTVSWGDMSSSWPLSHGGGFQGSLTGYDNVKFIARVYKKPFEEILAKTEGFAELGESLSMPVKYYSSGMRARLAFGTSLAIEFDCYLIDEVISAGDISFQAKAQDEIFGKRATRTFIIASHALEFIRETCSRAIVIESGRAKLFDDIGLAVDIYSAIGARTADAA